MTALERLPDWRARLAAELDRQRRLPFVWGKQDCALGLAAGAVEAVTGTDLRRGWRGKYSGARSAAKALRAAGWESLAEAVASILPETPVLFARVGDIGLIAGEGDLGEALCVIDASSLIVLTPEGQGRLGREHLIRAFKVG